MAVYDYNSLEEKYNGFLNPVADVKSNGKSIGKSSDEIVVSDVRVELTSGYEASEALFSVYNCFDREKGRFVTDSLRNYISLGSQITVEAGYDTAINNIFTGYVSKVDFVYGQNEIPHIDVFCMDIKGVMMAGNHECQLTSKNYGDSVREIFQKSIYQKMKSKGIYNELNITSTPDKGKENKGESDRTIEMTGESDYEFVVRAAKRFNYEFFADCGSVMFRKARTSDSALISLNTFKGIREVRVEYDMAGLVENILVRGMDYGKSELITAKKKLNNNISLGNRAKQIISGSEKICIDSWIKSREDADYRLARAEEETSFGFGTVRISCIGLPEIKPGSYMKIEDMGEPVSNKFYVTQVHHIIDDERGYVTIIIGKTDRINS